MPALAQDTLPLQIAIVGGGLGGLATALACFRLGIRVDVYEQASGFKEIGNGLSLQSNATRLVNEVLGLTEEYEKISAALDGSTYLAYADYRTGEIIQALASPSGPLLDRPHRIARSEMLDILRAPIPPEWLHTSKKLVRLERLSSGRYRLHFADESAVEADLVIGADGIHSYCRKYLQKSLNIELDEPVYSGQAAYRALVPRTAFTEEMQKILFTDGHRATTFRGPLRHFLVFAVGEEGKLLNVVAFMPEQKDASESWTARGSIQVLADNVKGWCEPVQEVVRQMGHIAPDCMKQSLYYRQPLEKWTDGNLVMLGDAAHPILPHQGQGTGMAIEDAVALAALLQSATRSNLGQRLEAYESLRKPRTDKMLLNSILMGKVSSSETADAEVSDHDRKMMGDRSWIWDYHVEVEARKVAQRLDAEKR